MLARRCGVFFAAIAVGIGCAACDRPAFTEPASTSVLAPTTSAAAATLTADQVGSLVVAAAHGATAVHVRGTAKRGSDTVKLDLQLNKDSASGTATVGDVTIPLRRIGSTYYAQMTDGIITMAGVSRTKLAPLLRDKWVSSDSKMGAGVINDKLKAFLDYDQFIAQAVDQVQTVRLTAAGTSTVDGVPVLVFRQSDGSTADVAAAAPHYLVRITDDAGALDFTGWDQPVPVVAPSAGEMYPGPGA